MSETTTTLARPHIALAADFPSNTGLTLADGTVWSHAATLGTFEKGGQFKLDAQAVQAFVANFRAGYPSKVPVDYDHGSTSGIADGSRRVPKAGDVVEMMAVLSDADVTPEIRAQIDAYDAQRARLGMKNKAPSYFGLWARWHPTATALSLVKDREYTEMSISFTTECVDNTGREQGPTIYAIALTNTPFLDNMIPVAASRSDGGAGAVSPQEIHSMADNDKKPTRFHVMLSALLGKPVETDEQSETELKELATTRQREMKELQVVTEFRSVIAAELDNENDPAKALVKLRALKAENAELKSKAGEATKTSVATQVESIMAKHEKKLTVPAKAMFTRNLTAELEAGKKAGETETEKVLGSMTEIPALAGNKESLADNGTNAEATEQFEATRAELYRTDPDVVEMAKTNPNGAYALSITKTTKKLSGASNSK